MKNTYIKSRAPTRIGIGGGGTDLASFFKKYEGAVLNVAIDLYSYTKIKRIPEKYSRIISYDWGIKKEITNTDLEFESNKKDNVDLIKAVMQESNINPLDGYEIITFSSAPKNSGLAGSSALLVSILIAMLNISNQQILDKKLLAEKAIKIEREVLKRSGGYQDQYATVFGGFNFIEFKKDDIRNYPLRLSNELTYELHSSMLLFETPHQREIMASQIEKEKEKDIDIGGESIEHLKLIKEYAYKMKNYLIRGDIKNLGEMLHLSWLEKKCLPGVENKFIDRLYEISREKGAYGGKICGAGGGGFLFLISDLDKRKDIIVTLEKQNCKLVNFNFDFDGATTWKII